MFALTNSCLHCVSVTRRSQSCPTAEEWHRLHQC